MENIKNKLAAAAAFLAFAPLAWSAQFNVSTNGSDTAGDGSKQKPFASLARAVKAAESQTEASEIVVGEGLYNIKGSVDLSKAASKGRALTIRGEGDVVFHGGVRVDGDALKLVKDKSLLSRLPEKVEGDLYGVDLKKLGVDKVGKMVTMGFGARGGVSQTEAFSNIMPLTLAQYPNGKDKIPLGKVLDYGFNRNEAAKWDNSREKISGVFEFTDPRHARWVNSEEVWLSGIFHHGWAYNTTRVQKIDADKKTVTLQNDLPSGLFKGKMLVVNAYQAFNIFEEIDALGEYYIDRKNCIFYVMLKSKPSSKDYFDFSLLDVPMIKMDNTENVTIKNIKFVSSRFTPITGDKTVRATIDNCEFRNLGSSAVNLSSASVDKYSKEQLAAVNNVFSNGKVFDTGKGGVIMRGGSEEKLLPSHNKVFNSEFCNNARLNKSYSPQVHLMGVGGILSHCYFHDHSHESVAYSGSEHVIEYNYFERCCRDFDDMGVIYTGRLPYNRGNVIRGNFFAETVASHKSSMMCGVYIDDGSGGTLVEKNIFCRVGTPGRAGGFSAVYFHGGKDNKVIKDVFIDCDVSASQVQWRDDKWKSYWVGREKAHLKHVDNEVYLKKYPEMIDIMNPSLKRMNTMQGCKLFRTQPPLRGKWDLSLPMEDMKPQIPCGEVEYWTADEVQKYFGNDPLVSEILKKKPGLLKN